MPHPRNLVPLDGLDPVIAAPLTDAALTPYRAVRKVQPKLGPGRTLAIIGVGGLGHMALQIVRALAPATRVIAIDISAEKLAMARSSAPITASTRAARWARRSRRPPAVPVPMR